VGTEPAADYAFLYWNGNLNQELWAWVFARKVIISRAGIDSRYSD
jgi:hypothetical protein